MSKNEDAAGESLLARYLLSEETLGETLAHVVDVAKRSLPADMAGITMIVDGRPTTAVFTDDEAPEIDDHQYQGSGGPCMDAFINDRMVAIHSVAQDSRWPEFATVAARYGINSTLSLPLSAPGGAVGALNLYSRQLQAFNFQDEEVGARLAGQAAVLLTNAQVYAEARELSENLRQALTSRSTIDYAIGLLMAPGGRSAEDAFSMLVSASQRSNRKLRDIAAEIVAAAEQRRTSRNPFSP